MTKKEIKIRNKKVTFSSKVIEGKTVYYRDGKVAESYYQRRIAKGILEGKSLTEARGHPFGKYSGKLLTKSDIESQEEFHLGAWAEPPGRGKRGQVKATYYMKVSVTSESVKKHSRPGSPTGTDDACVAVTMRLKNPNQNEQDGFTYQELSRNFEAIAFFTIDRYGHELCSGSLKNDLIAVWRHSRQ